MKRYPANTIVDEGIYLQPRRLAFESLEERGTLPGEATDVYVRVPALFVLPLGLLLSLAFVIFLPLVGFLMLARLVVEKLFHFARRGARFTFHALQPAWHGAHAGSRRSGGSRKPDDAG